jgi:hypothetical protein
VGRHEGSTEGPEVGSFEGFEDISGEGGS